VSEITTVVPMPVSDEKIGELRAAFAELSAETSEGYKEVKKAIQVCVKTRTAIDGKRQELNEEALRWQRTVNAEAKRLTALVEEIEVPLKAKKQAVDDEAVRRKKELEEKQRAFVQGRLDEFVRRTGKLCSYDLAESMRDDEWAMFIELGEKEAKRLAEKDAERKLADEQERRKLAESLELERAEKQRLQDEIDALRKEKIERERAERERMEAIEKERLLEEERKQTEQTEAVRKAAVDLINSERQAYDLCFDNALCDLQRALSNLGRIDRGAYRAAIGLYLDSAIQAVCDAQDKLTEFKGE
jgi:chromosome segregation ATPase